MTFNAPEFAPFFAAVFILNWLLIRRPTLRLTMLTLAGAYFYGCRHPWWLIPLFVQTAVDWWCAREIDAPGASELRRRAFVTISIVENLALLAFFKYWDFIVETAAGLAGALGRQVQWAPLGLAMPMGISFYTFVTMSYTVDVYRRRVPAERRFLPIAFFVGFFPHLVAGPIIRATSFLPQVHRRPSLDWPTAKDALFRVASGLFKKVVVADYLAQFVTQAFDHPAESGRLAAWVGVFAFSFQMYYDFCGYCDIAVGTAKLLGYELCENFERPYVAASVTEFWRRWHMSLSTWLRDYAGQYFYARCPLTKRRHDQVRTVWTLALTMLACGLWHGAAWHFVLWGALHGALLVFERLTGTGVSSRGMKGFSAVIDARRILTFTLVTLTFVVFRADGMSQAVEVLGSLVATGGALVDARGLGAPVAVMALGLAAQYAGESFDLQKAFLRMPFGLQACAYLLVALAIALGVGGGARPFIYFQY